MTRSRKRQRAEAAAAAPTEEAAEAAAAPAVKRTYDKPSAFLAQWLWKRESKSDKERFDEAYEYPHEPAGQPPATLRIAQRRFGPEGFASTVWDSAIVLSKYLERRAAGLAGLRAVELGAGCGLVSCVLARLGCHVTATDMACNLPLLCENLRANVPAGCGGSTAVAPLLWGAAAARRVAAEAGGDSAGSCDSERVAIHAPPSAPLPSAPPRSGAPATSPAAPGFDLVVATDVMYVHEAVVPLLDALQALCGARTEVLLAYGRNRPAEAVFLEGAAKRFSIDTLADEELHETYQCLDVSVLRLRLLRGDGDDAAAHADA